MINRRKTFLILLSVLASFILAGCSGSGPAAGDSASVQTELATLQASVVQSDRFWAEPAVIQACSAEAGKTVIHWNVPGLNRVEVHVESATGPLFTLAGPVGSKETGVWVRDKMRFYLVNVESKEVLETQMVRVTKVGCEQ